MMRSLNASTLWLLAAMAAFAHASVDGPVFMNELLLSVAEGTAAAVEVAGPAGGDVRGWQFLAFGADGRVLVAREAGGELDDTTVFADQAFGFGVLSFDFVPPAAEIRAGALVAPSGAADLLSFVDQEVTGAAELAAAAVTVAEGVLAGNTSVVMRVAGLASAKRSGVSLQLRGWLGATCLSQRDNGDLQRVAFDWEAGNAPSLGAVNFGQGFAQVSSLEPAHTSAACSFPSDPSRGAVGAPLRCGCQPNAGVFSCFAAGGDEEPTSWVPCDRSPLVDYDRTANAGIAGKFALSLDGLRPDECAAACTARSWCHSFDYLKFQTDARDPAPGRCDLSIFNADTSALNRDYPGNLWDYYERRPPPPHVDYAVRAFTSDIEGSGSAAKIVAILRGAEASTSKLVILDVAERVADGGHWAETRTGVDVGLLESVQLETVTVGDPWRCLRLVVSVAGREYTFPCDADQPLVRADADTPKGVLDLGAPSRVVVNGAWTEWTTATCVAQSAAACGVGDPGLLTSRRSCTNPPPGPGGAGCGDGGGVRTSGNCTVTSSQCARFLDGDGDGSDWSTGRIVGVVVGCVTGLTMLGFTVVMCLRRKPPPESQLIGLREPAPGQAEAGKAGAVASAAPHSVAAAPAPLAASSRTTSAGRIPVKGPTVRRVEAGGVVVATPATNLAAGPGPVELTASGGTAASAAASARKADPYDKVTLKRKPTNPAPALPGADVYDEVEAHGRRVQADSTL